MEIKINLSNTEHKELVSYCNLNDLLVSEIVKKSFISGFNIERYGLLGADRINEQVVEKIVEKIIEVPVEIEKEVVKIEYVEVEKPIEVIKEVPVEVIKEVEKIFQDNTKIEELSREFSTKTEEMEKNFQKEKNELLKQIEELGEGKIIEVPVEVIKEIVIEKETDSILKPKFEALQNTVQKLRNEIIEKDKKIKILESKIEEIENSHIEKKTVYLSGSNLNKTLKK